MSHDEIEKIHTPISLPSGQLPETFLNEMPERLKLEDFTFLKVIGKGSFGKVRVSCKLW